MTRASPFDAVLLISFGGPQGLNDVRPFLANVLKGRNVPQARVDEVAEHYGLFGGISPITELTTRQARALAQRLESRGSALPVYVGMRNWHPFLADTMSAMSRAGIRRAIGFIMAPHASYSSCEQYRENVTDARARLRASGLADVAVTYVASWYDSEGFVSANANQVRHAIERLPGDRRASPRLIFTAHSIPTSMADRSRYREQLAASSRLVAERVDIADWQIAYQSRSGRPQDSWLEPDVSDVLRESRAEGVDAVVLCPIGFVSDHIEVLYDLDRVAAADAEEIGLAFARAEAVNDHPAFIEMMADVVLDTVQRYASGRPLSLHKGVGPI